MSEKMYGSYSSADLDDWERFPFVSQVLTSSAFGAWLMRRDENRDKYKARKEGEVSYWIEDWEMGLSECPECHETYLWEDFKGVGDWHHCPNCGQPLEVRRSLNE